MIEDGQAIVQSSSFPGTVSLGFYYDFDGSDFNQTAGAPSDGYYVRNMSSDVFRFGLAQAVEADPTSYSPLCIHPLVGSENARFAPEETVYVFLTDYVQQGTVSIEVWGKDCQVTLEDGTPQTLCFAKADSQFYLSSDGDCPQGCPDTRIPLDNG